MTVQTKSEPPGTSVSRAPSRLPAWADYGLIPVLNVTAAFLVAGLVVLFIGENPLRAVRSLVYGALGYGEGVGFTLYYATNFILTGLAVAVAFHGSLFNIGGEGQAYVGGLGVALVALTFDRILPWWLLFPLAICGAALFGAAWAFIPAWLQARFGSHVVITTIMFNFIAASMMVWLLTGMLKPPGSQRRRRAPSRTAPRCRSSTGSSRCSGRISAARRSTSRCSWRSPPRSSSMC